MTKFTAIALLITLAAPAYAVTGNADIDNPGQTDPTPAPAAAPAEPDMSSAGGAVRWSPEHEDYNFDPKYICVSMVCADVQGGDR